MQPLHYDLRPRAAKDGSITHAAAAARNLDTAIPLWSAETALHNTIELRTAASEIAAPKPAGAIAGKKDFEAFSQKNFKEISSAKMEKKLCQPTIAHLMQPLQ